MASEGSVMSESQVVKRRRCVKCGKWIVLSAKGIADHAAKCKVRP
jgi:hypothetical protein